MEARRKGLLSAGGEEVEGMVVTDKGRGKGRDRGEKSGKSEGGSREVGGEEQSCEEVAGRIGRDIRAVAGIVKGSRDEMREEDRLTVLEMLVGVMGQVNELAAKWRRLERRMMEMELERMKEESRVRERERKLELEREEWRKRLEEKEERVRELEERLKRQEEEEGSLEEEDGADSERSGRKSELGERENRKQLGGLLEREGSGRESERVSEGESEHERSVCVEEEGAWGGRKESESLVARAERVAGSAGESGEDGARIEGKVVVVGPEGWRVPMRDGGEEEEGILIRSREGKGVREMMRELVGRLPGREIVGSPLAVRQAGEGEVVIIPRDREQLVKIRERVGEMKDMEVKERRGSPLVMISGLEVGMTEGEIREGLRRGMGKESGWGEEIRVVRRMRCRNEWRENVIVRMGLRNFREVVMKGKVEMRGRLCFAEEYLDLVICFRCCGFGHVSKYCKECVRCYVCGDEHDGRECKRERVRCANCWKLNGKDERHEARDFGCPVVRELLAKLRRSTRYE